jgi:methylmalonyl-CoA/ethylmalonyl-CoA epimerase
MEKYMVARMRHIALLVTDPEKSAVFYEKTLGFKRAGKAGRGLYMSDGTINMALLQVRPDKGEKPGLFHFGMWVDDLDQASDDVTAAGGTYLAGREDRNPNTFYEVKYRDPDGIVFDITPTGWRGAVKEVVPADENGREAAE